jgi:hypothetical protein
VDAITAANIEDKLGSLGGEMKDTSSAPIKDELEATKDINVATDLVNQLKLGGEDAPLSWGNIAKAAMSVGLPTALGLTAKGAQAAKVVPKLKDAAGTIKTALTPAARTADAASKTSRISRAVQPVASLVRGAAQSPQVAAVTRGAADAAKTARNAKGAYDSYKRLHDQGEAILGPGAETRRTTAAQAASGRRAGTSLAQTLFGDDDAATTSTGGDQQSTDYWTPDVDTSQV